jgi:hypothetical protein
MRNLQIGVLLCLAEILGCTAVADVTNKQSDAVNAASGATCDRYSACGQIGAGLAYTSRESCDSSAQDFWNAQWPAVDCDGHINGAALTLCTDHITATDCTNFGAPVTAVFTSCEKSDVCL